MGFGNNGFGGNGCLWIILIIILLCCCCGGGFRPRLFQEQKGTGRTGRSR